MKLTDNKKFGWREEQNTSNPGDYNIQKNKPKIYVLRYYKKNVAQF